jgi:GTP cyclohydrolase I
MREMEEPAAAPAETDNVIELPCAKTRRRELEPADWRRFEGYVGEIFTALGMDLDTPGTRDTPERYLRALFDSTAGYDGDPKLLTVFPAEGRGGRDSLTSQVIEGPIAFQSLCEHHALPFYGEAHVGYIPGDEIIGISKLTRLVRLYARRFTVQERLGEQVADTLADQLGPHGVAVHLEASHLCTQMRGVEAHSRTITTVWRGAFQDADLRREFLQEVRSRKG